MIGGYRFISVAGLAITAFCYLYAASKFFFDDGFGFDSNIAAILFHLFVVLYLLNFYQGIYLGQVYKTTRTVPPRRKAYIIILLLILALFQLFIFLPILKGLEEYFSTVRLYLRTNSWTYLPLVIINGLSMLIYLLAMVYIVYTFFVLAAIRKKSATIYDEIERIGENS